MLKLSSARSILGTGLATRGKPSPLLPDMNSPKEVHDIHTYLPIALTTQAASIPHHHRKQPDRAKHTFAFNDSTISTSTHNRLGSGGPTSPIWLPRLSLPRARPRGWWVSLSAIAPSSRSGLLAYGQPYGIYPIYPSHYLDTAFYRASALTSTRLPRAPGLRGRSPGPPGPAERAAPADRGGARRHAGAGGLCRAGLRRRQTLSYRAAR